MSEEAIIYTDNTVSISTSRIVIWSTTYALRNITSVKMGLTPPKSGCALIVLLIGVGIVIGGYKEMDKADHSEMLAGFIMGGIVCLVGLAWLVFAKPQYHLVIASSSGEVNALTSRDRVYIEKVVGSINDAIIRYR